MDKNSSFFKFRTNQDLVGTATKSFRTYGGLANCWLSKGSLRESTMNKEATFLTDLQRFSSCLFSCLSLLNFPLACSLAWGFQASSTFERNWAFVFPVSVCSSFLMFWWDLMAGITEGSFLPFMTISLHSLLASSCIFQSEMCILLDHLLNSFSYLRDTHNQTKIISAHSQGCPCLYYFPR